MADELEVEPRCVAVVVLDVVLGTAGVVLDDPSRVPLKRGRAVGWRRVVRESCKGGLLDRRERAEPRAESREPRAESRVEWSGGGAVCDSVGDAHSLVQSPPTPCPLLSPKQKP